MHIRAQSTYLMRYEGRFDRVGNKLPCPIRVYQTSVLWGRGNESTDQGDVNIRFPIGGRDRNAKRQHKQQEPTPTKSIDTTASRPQQFRQEVIDDPSGTRERFFPVPLVSPKRVAFFSREIIPVLSTHFLLSLVFCGAKFAPPKPAFLFPLHFHRHLFVT